MDTGMYLPFLAAALVIIVIPGPTNLMIVSTSMDAGVRRSLWTVGGAALSHALFIAATTAGVGALISRYPGVFVFLKWFGVLYLAIQGVLLIAKKQSQEPSEARVIPRRGALGCLAKGFLVNTTNPKALLFYAALFPPFVDPEHAFVPQLLMLASTFLALFVLVGAAHAAIGQKAAALLTRKRNAGLANKISGSVMLGAAVWIAAR